MAHDIQNFENQLCTSSVHFVNGKDMFSNFPAGTQQVQLGMGCFWGAERILWKLDGVHVTSVGYAGGHTPDPDYKKTCTGTTVISFDEILKVFFENHDPTQGNRQGNDTGPQYRSAIFTYTQDQMSQAKEAMTRYAAAYGRSVTTELRDAPTYFAAEDYHQQYLAKNPQGYCMHGPTGIVCHLPERAKETA